MRPQDEPPHQPARSKRKKNMSLAYYEANVGNEHSKSANATQAEAEGRFPMTIAAKKLGVSTKAFKSGCRSAKYESDEWHHTGSHARRTDYYDTTILAASGDFWRGCAKDYSEKAGAKLLAKHNVNPLTDAEIEVQTKTEIGAALARVNNFIAEYGERLVVQKQENHGEGWEAKGYKSQFKWKNAMHYNSVMESLGLFVGYDADSNWRRIHTTFEAADAYLKGWQERHAKSFPKEAPLELRVVTMREDICTSCALYGRVNGEFKRLGEARDFLVQ